MENTITRVQTDYTYEVQYKGADYTVTCEENLIEGYMEWSVFDDDGELVEELDPKLGDEIIAFMIENT